VVGRRVALFLGLAALVGGCSSTTTTRTSTDPSTTAVLSEARWPAPPDPMDRVVAAGLVPETHETLQHHVHAHLDVFVDGIPQTVPAGVGIDIDDPAVNHDRNILGQDSYGGISVPCEKPCISPLHTHDTTGTLHTESAVEVDNTLGQFFVEWGVRLDGECVGEFCAPEWPIEVYVDGATVPTDRTLNLIGLTDRREIAIVIGRPPAVIPSTFPTG
jgi:hypothetical protein